MTNYFCANNNWSCGAFIQEIDNFTYKVYLMIGNQVGADNLVFFFQNEYFQLMRDEMN